MNVAGIMNLFLKDQNFATILQSNLGFYKCFIHYLTKRENWKHDTENGLSEFKLYLYLIVKKNTIWSFY